MRIIESVCACVSLCVWVCVSLCVCVCHCVCMRETAQEKSVTSDVMFQYLPVMMALGSVCVFCMCHFQTTQDEAAVLWLEEIQSTVDHANSNAEEGLRREYLLKVCTELSTGISPGYRPPS